MVCVVSCRFSTVRACDSRHCAISADQGHAHTPEEKAPATDRPKAWTFVLNSATENLDDFHADVATAFPSQDVESKARSVADDFREDVSRAA